MADLKPKSGRYAFPDPELAGHYIRVTPNGVKTYVAVARNPFGKQIWATIGPTDHLKIADAREEWRGRDFETIRRGDVAKLLDKVEDKAGSRSADYRYDGNRHWRVAMRVRPHTGT